MSVCVKSSLHGIKSVLGTARGACLSSIFCQWCTMCLGLKPACFRHISHSPLYVSTFPFTSFRPLPFRLKFLNRSKLTHTLLWQNLVSGPEPHGLPHQRILDFQSHRWGTGLDSKGFVGSVCLRTPCLILHWSSGHLRIWTFSGRKAVPKYVAVFYTQIFGEKHFRPFRSIPLNNFASTLPTNDCSRCPLPQQWVHLIVPPGHNLPL